jgi:CelD/BcsL family acetyltransferase involved in cellulose biosynthesis
MDYRFTQESFDSLADEWTRLQVKSSKSYVFSSPEWSRVWWQHFGSDSTLRLCSVKKHGEIIGIAPLLTRNNTAYFIGNVDVCDYLDFIVEPGEEDNFFKSLLENLAKAEVSMLDLAHVRPDSTVVTNLMDIAQRQGLQTSLSKEDISLELNLPATWEEYLQLLAAKQRHELKRKLRRLAEMGKINFRTSTDANPHDIDMFIRLFQVSREDKAAFLTSQRESFFRSLFSTMAQTKLLRLNVLELNATPIASTICLDFKDVVYLYNSGYEPDFSWLSAGLISKAMCIQDSIQRNKKRFDFLKGNEEYKYHLGGHELPLYRCSVNLYK